MNVSNPIKWHGGKSYLAKAILEQMPPRCRNSNRPDDDDRGWLHYVEVYAGGLAVLLAQDGEGISEVANDLNGELTNFWNVLRSSEDFPEFQRLLTFTPFSQTLYKESQEPLLEGTKAERAWNFFVRCRQSMSGRFTAFAPMSRTRTRRGMNEQAAAWLSAIEGLPEVHARLKRVVILNEEAVKVIGQQDGPRTMFYCDPPYLHETRVTTGEYAHEMSEEDHARLLAALAEIRGRFILSGYPSGLYDHWEKKCGWRRVDIQIDNKASNKAVKDKKTESLWMNYSL